MLNYVSSTILKIRSSKINAIRAPICSVGPGGIPILSCAPSHGAIVASTLANGSGVSHSGAREKDNHRPGQI